MTKRGISKALRLAAEVYARNRRRIGWLQEGGSLSLDEAQAMRAAGAAAMLAELEAEAQRGRGAPKGRGRVVGGGMLTPARVVPETKPRVQARRGGRVKHSEGDKIALRAAVDAVMASEGGGVVGAVDWMLRGEVERGEMTKEQARKERNVLRALYYRAVRADRE